MDTVVMSAYRATMPPQDAKCDMSGCSTVAMVRLIIPRSQFEADGIDHSNDPSTFDTCECHWPGMRDTLTRNGHEVIDVTGDIRQLAADFPHWRIFRSDGARLYATARLKGSNQGTTVHAHLVTQLRALMQAAEKPQPLHHE